MTFDASERPGEPTYLEYLLSRSLFDRLISRPRPLWVTVSIILLLVSIPLLAAYLDGILGDFFGRGYWRMTLLSPAIIGYILIVSPMTMHAEIRVIEALRPLIELDDDGFGRLLGDAVHLNPIGEAAAFVAGAIFGLWYSQSWLPDDVTGFWLRLYNPLFAGLMLGLLAWTIYAAVAGTRLLTALHRQPMHVDIFDTKPFESVGRQSLVVALVFVGGLTLGVVFSISPEDVLSWQAWLFSWESWIINVPLIVVPILIFFFSMRDTHRVLAAEKRRDLEEVQRHILLACRTLMARRNAGEDTGSLGDEINALVAYEKRIQQVGTWPYDVATLRTLFFSVLLPAGAALGRIVFDTLSQ